MNAPYIDQIEVATARTEHYNGETLEYIRYDFYYWPFIYTLIFAILLSTFFARFVVEFIIRMRKKYGR